MKDEINKQIKLIACKESEIEQKLESLRIKIAELLAEGSAIRNIRLNLEDILKKEG